MKIYTKYDVGQVVWIMCDNEPDEWVVERIIIGDVTSNTPPMPQYFLKPKNIEAHCYEHMGCDKGITMWQYKVFETKRELCLSFINDKD